MGLGGADLSDEALLKELGPMGGGGGGTADDLMKELGLDQAEEEDLSDAALLKELEGHVPPPLDQAKEMQQKMQEAQAEIKVLGATNKQAALAKLREYK